MDIPKLDFLNFEDNKIPIPNPDFLRETLPPPSAITKKDEKPLVKHERAYDAFCRWSSLPPSERKPVTVTAFETKWKVPKGYSTNFKERADFRDRVLRYHWEWMLEKWPEVAEAIYIGARKGNTAQAKVFAELMTKHIEADKPKKVIQPFMLVGVSQEKINKLFVPDGYENVEDILPADLSEEES